MKFWKSVISVVVSIFLCAGIASTANAALAYQRMKIGNISFDLPMSDVQRMYGKPNKTMKNEEGFIVHIYKGFRVLYGEQKVKYLIVEGNCNMATKDGVKIGTQESVLKKTYGKPTYISKDNGETYYSYADADGGISLDFTCKNGKIIMMCIGLNV